MADAAQLVFEIDSAQAAGAAKALLQLDSAAAKASSEAAKLERQWRTADGRFQSAEKAARGNAREIESLAGKYNTALSVQLQYARAQEEVARAVKLGVIAEEQKDAVLERVQQQFLATGQAAGQYGKYMQGAALNTGNVFAQLNDIGVMLAAGQNPIQLALQQGTQLNQVWASMGKEGQSVAGVAGVLRNAFASMISPMSLLTLGVIAGGAALVQWGMSALGAGVRSRSFEDDVDAASEAISRANASAKRLATSGLSEVIEKYGQVNDGIRALIESETQLGLSTGAKELQKVLEDLGSKSLIDRFGPDDFVADLSQAFETSFLAANDLRLELEAIGRMKSLEQQAAAIESIRSRLSDATNGFTDMTTVQDTMLERLNKADDLVKQLISTSNNLPAAFNAAANAAAKITAELDRAINAAAQLASAGISDVRRAQIELDYRTDPVGRARALAAAQFDETVGKGAGMDSAFFNQLRNQAMGAAEEVARLNMERERLDKLDRDAERAGKGGVGRAARELAAAEKGFLSLQELLQRESMFQVAEYEKRQEQLDTALAKKLLSEEQYQLMKQQLQAVYFGTEYEQNQVQYQMDLDALNAAHEAKLLSEEQYLMKRSELQNSYYSNAIGVDQSMFSQQLSQMSQGFAQMNQLAGGGYDSLLKAQKIFASGSALINAYLAASQALADPTLGFFGKMIAYGKVLAAGLGLANAIRGSGSSSSSSASTSATTTTTEPTKNILINLTDLNLSARDEELIETVITEIYQQSKDGRVIIARG